MKTFELRLIPYELHAAIKAAAFREGVSMNKWILHAVERRIWQDQCAAESSNREEWYANHPNPLVEK